LTEHGEDRAEQGTLLVGVANPATIDHLMGLAAILARGDEYRVVATHIVTVPNQMALGAARQSPEVAAGTRLLQQAINEGARNRIAVRGVVEVAREVHEGLLSAAVNQEADLILVGYSDADERNERAERHFDRIMYRVARNTRANLLVAKFRTEQLRTILMPLLGGQNLPVSGMVLNAIRAHRPDVRVTFIRAIHPDEDVAENRADLHRVLAEYGLEGVGAEEIVVSEDPQAAIVERAEDFDLAIIGAERPTIVEAIFGNMAERIASQAACSALLVRASGRPHYPRQ